MRTVKIRCLDMDDKTKAKVTRAVRGKILASDRPFCFSLPLYIEGKFLLVQVRQKSPGLYVVNVQKDMTKELFRRVGKTSAIIDSVIALSLSTGSL